jgi:asparagine synthase (glutamine-hydrolysing)
MCGIAGQFSLLPEPQASQRGDLLRQALRHRGPDGEGTWPEDEGRVLLVHTRLAIQDLSLAGHQPMEWEGKSSVDSLRSSAVADPAAAGDELEQATGDSRPMTDDSAAPCGPVIVFNGEIYNFRELRAELEAEGWVFRTRTDTEVILALYVRDGQRCVERLRGMFAFVIWDEAARSVFLARDPLGIKPLYLCEGDGKLAFASELRPSCGQGSVGGRSMRRDWRRSSGSGRWWNRGRSWKG